MKIYMACLLHRVAIKKFLHMALKSSHIVQQSYRMWQLVPENWTSNKECSFASRESWTMNHQRHLGSTRTFYELCHWKCRKFVGRRPETNDIATRTGAERSTTGKHWSTEIRSTRRRERDTATACAGEMKSQCEKSDPTTHPHIHVHHLTAMFLCYQDVPHKQIWPVNPRAPLTVTNWNDHH